MLLEAKQTDARVSIELTPLVDMVFLLLIFFLVATTFHQEEREMQIALPAAKAAGPISANLRELIINVDREGQIFVGGRSSTPDELRELVAQRVAVNPEQKVAVRGDRGAVYGNVVRVLDICKAAGIQEPYLDTIFDE
jgi:biopolymer transport protein ExbD